MLTERKARELLRALAEAGRARVPFADLAHLLEGLDAHELEGAEGQHADAWRRHERTSSRELVRISRRTGRARTGAR